MADYTFNKLTDLAKNDSSIQTVLDVDALAAPAKAALAGYVASMELPSAQTQHLLWENVGVAVLIQQLSLIYYLPSLGSQTPAPALKRTSTLSDKVIEMQALESKFPKCQILIFGKNPGEDWIWLNAETIQNSGNRVNTLKLLPYISQSDSFIPGRGTKIGIQFIADPVSKATLPQAGDRLTVSASVAMDVNPMDAVSKKNNDVTEVEQLKTRLTALETLLQPFGAATATAAGTAGLVSGAAAGQSDYLLRGDRLWQNPAAFVRMLGDQLVAGVKTFVETITSNKAIRSVGVGDLGGLSAQSQAAIWCSGGGGYLSLVSAAAPANTKIVDFELNSQGIFSLRRINDAYNAVVSTLLQFDASHNLKLNNFTNFGGNVSLKLFSISGTTPSGQGGTLFMPLTIDSAKVVGFHPAVHNDANARTPPGYTAAAGSEYYCYIDDSFLVWKMHSTNSANVINKACSCLVIYSN